MSRTSTVTRPVEEWLFDMADRRGKGVPPATRRAVRCYMDRLPVDRRMTREQFRDRWGTGEIIGLVRWAARIARREGEGSTFTFIN